jgi:hypothetical protein
MPQLSLRLYGLFVEGAHLNSFQWITAWQGEFGLGLQRSAINRLSPFVGQGDGTS